MASPIFKIRRPAVQPDIAREAAEAGIDDVLWDYMRRPEGRLDSMYIPGVGLDDPFASNR